MCAQIYVHLQMYTAPWMYGVISTVYCVLAAAVIPCMFTQCQHVNLEPLQNKHRCVSTHSYIKVLHEND